MSSSRALSCQHLSAQGERGNAFHHSSVPDDPLAAHARTSSVLMEPLASTSSISAATWPSAAVASTPLASTSAASASQDTEPWPWESSSERISAATSEGDVAVARTRLAVSAASRGGCGVEVDPIRVVNPPASIISCAAARTTAATPSALSTRATGARSTTQCGRRRACLRAENALARASDTVDSRTTNDPRGGKRRHACLCVEEVERGNNGLPVRRSGQGWR